MSEITKQYSVDLTRVENSVYRATNADGASVEFGRGEGLL